MSLAEVVQLDWIEKHPDKETHSLVILQLSNGVNVVTGPHYEVGILGVYVAPGAAIPGWMAEDAWILKKGDRWLIVESKPMRGVDSPGLFYGQRWRDRPDREEQFWTPWRDRWKPGDDVSAYLGVLPVLP